MRIYEQIYRFGASAGAFEGYVYRKSAAEMDMEALHNWVDNLHDAYEQLPLDVRRVIQPWSDRTLGRALHSLKAVLGDNHRIVTRLQTMVAGELPASADDFDKEKGLKR